MTTPLLEAAGRYLDAGFSRLHMPGHKGATLPVFGDIARYDLTEITGLDSLYHADGPVAALERAYAQLYGTRASLVSAGGSTLCIQAMLALACAPGAKLLAARGVHTSAVNAMALLDLRPAWLYPGADEESGLALPVTAGDVEAGLAAHPDAAAVYVTSPGMFGAVADIAAISAVCRARSVPLLVDNAHGAYLKFLSPSRHPADLGADLCCDSLHKTLPVLTGGALLHIQNPAYLPHAKARMALFGSTSPSYLIMLSMDTALPYMETRLAADVAAASARVRGLAALAREHGFSVPPDNADCLRLVLGFGALGLSQPAFAAHLASCKIEPEYLGARFCVLMAGGFNTDLDYARIEKLIRTAERGDAAPPPPFTAFPAAKTVLSPRQAMFAPQEAVPPELAAGRIAGAVIAPCPPGVPLAVCGEELSPDLAAAIKNSGIPTINVVK